MSISTSAVTVQEMSTGKGTTSAHPDDVKFQFQYSKDFKGIKYSPEGEVTVMNKDLAADFAKRGMGFIVTNEASAAPAVEETNQPATDEAKASEQSTAATEEGTTNSVEETKPAGAADKGKGKNKQQ